MWIWTLLTYRFNTWRGVMNALRFRWQFMTNKPLRLHDGGCDYISELITPLCPVVKFVNIAAEMEIMQFYKGGVK